MHFVISSSGDTKRFGTWCADFHTSKAKRDNSKLTNFELVKQASEILSKLNSTSENLFLENFKNLKNLMSRQSTSRLIEVISGSRSFLNIGYPEKLQFSIILVFLNSELSSSHVISEIDKRIHQLTLELSELQSIKLQNL